METRNNYITCVACSMDPTEEEVFIGFLVVVNINITHNNPPIHLPIHCYMARAFSSKCVM